MATTPIRPPIIPPGLTGAPARAEGAKLAAQRAFFDLAMGRAAPAQAAAAPSAAVATPPAAPQPTALQGPSEPPTKILRPGSLLDIRV